MKACENCDRIQIGRNFAQISKTRTFIGLFFVYLPIIFLPFLLLAAATVYLHLRLMGAQNLKTLGSYLPDRASHRYSRKNQIVYRDGPKPAFWSRTKVFWLFNCTWYCPFSVATLEWSTYLVKTVENWWCPFTHDRKENYDIAAIDSSYWHTPAKHRPTPRRGPRQPDLQRQPGP